MLKTKEENILCYNIAMPTQTLRVRYSLVAIVLSLTVQIHEKHTARLRSPCKLVYLQF